MGMPVNTPRTWRFGVFELDASSGELRRNGAVVKLRDQPARILVLLLEHAGQMVTREQLRQHLWLSDTFVDFDHSLNSAVMKLREALGDSADKPLYIETIPKKGYRFVAPLLEAPTSIGLLAPDPSADPSNNHQASNEAVRLVATEKVRERRWKLSVAVVVALAVLASFMGLYNEQSYLSRTRLGILARHLVLGSRSTVIERRITANPDDVPVTSAVISPDGKYLAFTDRTGFYLRQVERGETHAVPLPEGFEPLAESWFPDSVHLVVSRLEDNNKASSLWEISVLGGTPRKLADDASSARVSPDGSKITFLRGRIESGEIWLIKADGSHPQRVIGGTEPEGEDGFSPVAWSPDGKRIAYVRTTAQYFRRDETKVEIADVTTRESRVVVSRTGLGRVLGWPHDKKLIYSLEEPNPDQNDFNLWSFDVDSRAGTGLSSDTRITSDRGEIAELSLTSDGKLLAVRRRIPEIDVYVAELKDGGKRLGPPQRLTLDDRQDYPYSWTPDSKTVIFTSNRDGPWHIFKQTIDQTQPELMVGGVDDLAIPRLSPDNTELLYLVAPKRAASSHTVRIMRVPLLGGPPQLVLEGPWIWNHQCARLPSRLCIYTPSETNEQRFFRFDPVTGARSEIAAAKITGITGAVFVSWSLSPDGKYLATAERTGNNQPTIRILSTDGNTQKLLLVQRWGQIGGVDWAADGKSLWVGAANNVATLGRSNAWALLKLDLDGTIKAVVEDSSVRFSAAIPSPDGHRVAFFSRTTDPSNVSLLENF